jgi:hypothetical protein
VVERVVRTLPLALSLVGALAVGGCEGSKAARDAAPETLAVQEPEPVDAELDGSGVTVQGPGRAIPISGTSGPTETSSGAGDGARRRPQRDAGVSDAAVITDAGTIVSDAAVDAAGVVASDMCGRIRCDCTLRGIPLFGNVTYVIANGDFKIRETLDPDLLVQTAVVPTSCGMWAQVPSGADFTVEFVTTGEDFQIMYAVAPGVAKAPGTP